MPSVSKLNKVNFSSASHREPLLVLVRGQILKQVQDDVGGVFCCFANGQRLTANGCCLEFRCKDITLFCDNKIKTELFLLIL